jgi:hypothetical protein
VLEHCRELIEGDESTTFAAVAVHCSQHLPCVAR